MVLIIHAASWLLIVSIVVGGRSSIRKIAQSFEKVYGVPATVERRGSLDDLYKHMHVLRSSNPQNVYGYMSLYVSINPLFRWKC